MARTGVDIQILDAKFAVPPEVNQNTMIIVFGAAAVTPAAGALGFSLDVPYRLTSVGDLTALGVTAANNPEVYRHVVGFYTGGGVNRTGTLLWIVGSSLTTLSNLWPAGDFADGPSTLAGLVRRTTVESFEYRPRQVILAGTKTGSDLDFSANVYAQMVGLANAEVMRLFSEGYAFVVICAPAFVDMTAAEPVASTIQRMVNLSVPDPDFGGGPMVGVLVVSDTQNTTACGGRFGGWLAKTAVGQSVGDPSLGEFAPTMYFTNAVSATGSPLAYTNTPCSSLSLTDTNTLGDKQYLFTMRRPPKDGMYMNDGATANDPGNALSTLEAARTICAYADDLRLYFTNYINTQVPVIPSGEADVPAQLDPSWVEIVLEGARSQVSRKYIDNGDISDDRMTLRAKNDDFLGTRTLEVTSSLLPAFTLRWVDGSVSYVKNL